MRISTFVVTKGVHDYQLENKDFHKLVYDCLHRFQCADWGDCCEEDKKTNDAAIDPKDPGRVMSVYKFEDGRVLWVITEWDRSRTTALLPEEY